MKFKILIFSFFTISLFAQEKKDSLNITESFTPLTPYSLQRDWNILTYPFNSYLQNNFYISSYPHYSLHEFYTDYRINNSPTYASPDVMLYQFRLSQNWAVKQKYGIFAKYLGMAELFGTLGLAAIHISKFNPPPKGKTNGKNFQKFIKPQNNGKIGRKEIP